MVSSQKRLEKMAIRSWFLNVENSNPIDYEIFRGGKRLTKIPMGYIEIDLYDCD